MEAGAALTPGVRRSLLLQREIGRLFSVVWVPLTAFLLRFGFGWRIRNVREIRSRYREICADRTGPLIICANHLTMVDSAIIAWALGSPGWYLANFSYLPWNMPEGKNFANTPLRRALVYLMKCVPVVRGASRQRVADALARVQYLARTGEVFLLFPEGGRSRSGHVEVENAAHGVGRLVGSLTGCRVLCVYARGERQDAMGEVPVRGEVFRVETSLLTPKSSKRGVRRSLDIARQIVQELRDLEIRVLDEVTRRATTKESHDWQ